MTMMEKIYVEIVIDKFKTNVEIKQKDFVEAHKIAMQAAERFYDFEKNLGFEYVDDRWHG